MQTRDLFSPDGLADMARPVSQEPAAPCGSRADLDRLDEAAFLGLLLEQFGAPAGRVRAEALLQRFGDLQHALGATHADLARVVGDAPALQLRLVHELARRILLYPMLRRCVISSWTALLSYLRLTCAGAPREQFRVIFLDKKNQLIADEVMGEGTLDHAPVYPREVVRRALELNACAMILCHQHPSGDPTPSSADVEMTRRVIEAAKALSISVHDHIVVGGDSTASLKALGLI